MTASGAHLGAADRRLASVEWSDPRLRVQVVDAREGAAKWGYPTSYLLATSPAAWRRQSALTKPAFDAVVESARAAGATISLRKPSPFENGPRRTYWIAAARPPPA